VPCILVHQQVDRVRTRPCLPFAQQIAAKRDFAAIVPYRQAALPAGRPAKRDQALPAGEPAHLRRRRHHHRSEKFLASEIVREKLFRFVGEELPYTSTVLIEKFEQEAFAPRLRRHPVERDTHKSMIIGNKGARLKEISTQPGSHGKTLRARSTWKSGQVKSDGPTTKRLRAYGYE